MNVGQALLQDPEQRKFERTGQAAQVFRHIQTGLNAAAFRETLHIPFRRGSETSLIQQRRMQ